MKKIKKLSTSMRRVLFTLLIVPAIMIAVTALAADADKRYVVLADDCIGCEACVGICPEGFRMIEYKDGYVAEAYGTPKIGPVEAAIEACPVGAIFKNW